MKKVLVISGHPNLASSNANSLIIKELQAKVGNIEVRQLDKLYPDFKIDVAAEQKAMLAADTIVLQFPLHWYSVPALLKKWIDEVFTFNFAYGPEGDKLAKKYFQLSFTAGGPAQAYSPLGYNHFTIEQLIHPLQQLSYLAKMEYLAPIYTHEMSYIPNVQNKLEDVQARAQEHAARLIAKLNSL